MGGCPNNRETGTGPPSISSIRIVPQIRGPESSQAGWGRLPTGRRGNTVALCATPGAATPRARRGLRIIHPFRHSSNGAPRLDRRACDIRCPQPDGPRTRTEEQGMAVVEVERSNGIMVVRMNRPERMNALNQEVREAMAEA